MSSNLVVIPPGRGHSSQFEVTRTIGIDIIVGRYPEGTPLPRDADELELAPGLSSADHLPDITRCAASATASAINVPSLVALAITLLAA